MVSFLEKIPKLFVETPVIEICSNKDYDARHMKPFVKYITRELERLHPDMTILSTLRTDVLRNYDHPFLAGLFHGYVIKLFPGIDLYKLKESCMSLELDENGNRHVDIDVYRSWKDKISRKDLPK